jgi:chromosome segregation ATPase
MRRTAGALAVSGVLLAGWTILRAPTTASAAPAQVEIMPALLEEVRGLRAALEQMSSAGARVQLALGRLQLQEARLNTSVKRLDEARERLAQALKQQAEAQQQVAGLERELKEQAGRGRGSDGPTPEQLEDVRNHHRHRLALFNADVQRLTAEEATYANDVASEQARWIEFNQRLEDLERALRPLK